MTTPTEERLDFDALHESVTAFKKIEERIREITDRAKEEAGDAMNAARLYATHLEAGGDPTELPRRPDGDAAVRWSRDSELVSFSYGMQVVYKAWNQARGTRNPYSAVTEPKSWRIAEYAEARIGQPILYSDISAAVVRMTSDDIAKVLAPLQGDDLVLRRTKVGGKVAYLLRARAEGEEPAGRESGGRISVSASDVPEERWAGA